MSKAKSLADRGRAQIWLLNVCVCAECVCAVCRALCRHEEVEQKKDKALVIEKVIPHRRHKEAVRKVKNQKEKCEPLQQVAVCLCFCASSLSHLHPATHPQNARSC